MGLKDDRREEGWVLYTYMSTSVWAMPLCLPSLLPNDYDYLGVWVWVLLLGGRNAHHP